MVRRRSINKMNTTQRPRKSRITHELYKGLYDPWIHWQWWYTSLGYMDVVVRDVVIQDSKTEQEMHKYRYENTLTPILVKTFSWDNPSQLASKCYLRWGYWSIPATCIVISDRCGSLSGRNNIRWLFPSCSCCEPFFLVPSWRWARSIPAPLAAGYNRVFPVRPWSANSDNGGSRILSPG